MRSSNKFSLLDDAAHELRTPLSVFQSNLQIATDDPAFASEGAQILLATLRDSASRLERLVSDLLVLSREDRLPTLTDVSIGVILEQIKFDLRNAALERKVRIELRGDLSVSITGDESLLTKGVFNLVENGILYNRPGGVVEIIVEETDNLVEISVSDTGVGILDGKNSRIFDRFYRSDRSVSLNQSGTGLGLAIAKRIIELHRGTISASDRPSSGSVFAVTLPCAK